MSNVLPIIVPIPSNTIRHFTTTFSRSIMGGTIHYVVNPTTPLVYSYNDATNPDLYNGGVKLYNSNNLTSTERLCTNLRDVLIPTKTNIQNGLVKLVIVDDGVAFYYYKSSTQTYILMNTFAFDINTVEAKVINSKMVVLQIEDTLWTMKMGQPFVYVQHPNTVITYTLKQNYYHDGVLEANPTANELISMTNIAFPDCQVYQDADPYRMMIVKRYPTNIYTDSLPADNSTIIGWFNTSGTGYDTSSNIVKEMFNPIDYYDKPYQVIQ